MVCGVEHVFRFLMKNHTENCSCTDLSVLIFFLPVHQLQVSKLPQTTDYILWVNQDFPPCCNPHFWLQWMSSTTTWSRLWVLMSLTASCVVAHLCAADCGCWWLGSGTGHHLLAHRWGGSLPSHWSTPQLPAHAHWTYSKPSLANRWAEREEWKYINIRVNSVRHLKAYPYLIIPSGRYLYEGSLSL